MFTCDPDLIVIPRPDYWALAAPLHWDGPALKTIIPAGFVTDLATIPRGLRDVFDRGGLSRAPAILHDWLYSNQACKRLFADDQLFMALLAYGESDCTAHTYYRGVRLGGWWPWWQRLRRGGGLQVDDFLTEADYKQAIVAGVPP